MEFGASSNIGTRKINQDFWYKSDMIDLYIIADGMGGHNAGEIASKLSSEMISDYLEIKLNGDLSDEEIKDHIGEAIRIANKTIYIKSLEEDSLNGMGTTVSLAFIKNDKLYIGHVGDSSIFLIEDDIRKLTVDHSLVEELLKEGSISKEEAKNHPQKNVITRAVGSDLNIEVDIYQYELASSFILVLSTDGLSNIIDRDYLRDKLLTSSDLQKTCDELSSEAKAKGGKDNITIVVVKK